MSSEVVISVEDVSKCYTIYDRPHDRLKQSFLPRLQRLLGENGARYYREFWALRNVSFEVRKGETFGIIGRNGSGKSTLLQIIAGTVSPNEGNVRTYGRVAALLELGSGFNPDFTGRENVYLNGSLYGLSRSEIDARVSSNRGVCRHRLVHRSAGADLLQRHDRPACLRGHRACRCRYSGDRRGPGGRRRLLRAEVHALSPRLHAARARSCSSATTPAAVVNLCTTSYHA